MNNQVFQIIDDIFRQIDREVWIVTAEAGGRRGGLVATWVSQSSIDPQRPMLVAAIAPSHYTHDLIERSGALVAHLITAEQVKLAWQFGLKSGRNVDKFVGLEATNSGLGAPILHDCLAWLECKVVTKYETGDRTFYWTDVVAGEKKQVGPPLRERELFAAANAEQLAALKASRMVDARTLQAAAAQWRAQFPS